MKSLLFSIYCVVIVYGCKPVDHSQSEEKGIVNIAKQVAKKFKKAKKLDEVVIRSIKKLAKTDDQAGIDNMKMLLQKGGKQADQATLAYRRAYEAEIASWGAEMEYLKKRHNLIIDEIRRQAKRGNPHRPVLFDEINAIRPNITEHLRKLEGILYRRSRQIEKIVNINNPTKQMNHLTPKHFAATEILGLKFHLKGGVGGELKFPVILRSEQKFLNDLAKGNNPLGEEIIIIHPNEAVANLLESIKQSLGRELTIYETIAKKLNPNKAPLGQLPPGDKAPLGQLPPGK